jgi:PKD repeat protein
MPLFFMTWGRKNGDASNCASWPPVCTYNGMDSLLNLRYRMLADSNNAYVSPVGAVWHYIRDNHANIDLYSSDNSHPSLSGSYAAACTFYSLIYQKDPTLITDNYGLSAADALAIRNAAKLIAYDSLSKWNVGKYKPIAKFAINKNFSSAVFSNTSLYSSSYLWNFGDGNSSTLFEPSHTYGQNGTYNVKLKAMHCNAVDSIIHNITITVGINPNQKTIAKLFPNPIKNSLILEFEKVNFVENITLISIDGKLIKKFPSQKAKSLTLNFEDIDSGIYFLSYEINGGTFWNKVLVE